MKTIFVCVTLPWEICCNSFYKFQFLICLDNLHYFKSSYIKLEFYYSELFSNKVLYYELGMTIFVKDCCNKIAMFRKPKWDRELGIQYTHHLHKCILWLYNFHINIHITGREL